MKKTRQLHLWIGLLTSFLILVEAITGLLMLEPWLMGINEPVPEQRVLRDNTGSGQEIMAQGIEREKTVPGRLSEPASGGNSIMSFVKNLHAGRIGNADVSLLLDVVAIGLIILTVTGMILSLRALRVLKPRRQ